MAKIFPTNYDEKLTIAVDDMILFSDSEDSDKLKKAKYSNLKGETGDTGAAGDKGDTGDTGAKGDTGDTGATGADGTSFIREGAYAGGTTYAVDDVASYLGSSYICILESTGNLPTNATYWEVMAEKGEDGAGSGDVMGPATNTDSYIPQWDGADSKTLKDGIPTSTFAPALGADDNYVTDAEKTVIGNTSGTNSGDQTSIVGISGTTAQFNTALSDGSFATGGGTATGTNTGDQDLSSYATKTGTETLTNKRITPRIGTVADAATITPVGDSNDMYTVTALAQAATIAAPSGTPTNGQKLMLRLKDDSTTRALTWNAIYNVVGVTLPTDTTAGKTHYIGCVYNTANSKWDVLAVGEEA